MLPNLSERQRLYKLAASGFKLRELFGRDAMKTEGGGKMSASGVPGCLTPRTLLKEGEAFLVAVEL